MARIRAAEKRHPELFRSPAETPQRVDLRPRKSDSVRVALFKAEEALRAHEQLIAHFERQEAVWKRKGNTKRAEEYRAQISEQEKLAADARARINDLGAKGTKRKAPKKENPVTSWRKKSPKRRRPGR